MLHQLPGEKWTYNKISISFKFLIFSGTLTRICKSFYLFCKQSRHGWTFGCKSSDWHIFSFVFLLEKELHLLTHWSVRKHIGNSLLSAPSCTFYIPHDCQLWLLPGTEKPKSIPYRRNTDRCLSLQMHFFTDWIHHEERWRMHMRMRHGRPALGLPKLFVLVLLVGEHHSHLLASR